MSDQSVKDTVKERYGSIAKEEASCCAPAASEASCCGASTQDTISKGIGYSDEDLQAVPEGANLGLGCGNPLALSSVKEGDTVLDLGSGAGFDCFLAAKRTGESGHVIGVDMTPEMLAKARANAEKGGYTNVEFREGEIEKLPVEDNSVDIVISNCVINLSSDKEAVFSEIHRVLKPGGRFFVSDIVLSAPLPESILASAAAYTACVAGALLKEDYLAKIEAAGFNEVNVMNESTFPLDALPNDPTVRNLMDKLEDTTAEEIEQAAQSVRSVQVEGKKDSAPSLSCCGP